MLFSNKKKHEIQMPATNSEADSPSTIADLINFLCDNLMDDPRKDLFVLEDTVYVVHDLDDGFVLTLIRG